MFVRRCLFLKVPYTQNVYCILDKKNNTKTDKTLTDIAHKFVLRFVKIWCYLEEYARFSAKEQERMQNTSLRDEQ
jgi:hypothetical protein